MRLYLNTKEIPILKQALRDECERIITEEEYQRLRCLIERVELCEQLQDNVKEGARK